MKPRGMSKGISLRKKAEEIFYQRPQDVRKIPVEDIKELIHDLDVHQIELEMQNDELRKAQAEIELSRAKYVDLYDFAPVGYCTLSAKGLIVEVNLTAATLLGVVRGRLIKHPLVGFVFKEDQGIYYRHLKRLFESGAPQICELRMVKKNGTSFWVHLATAPAQDENGAPVCRVVMSDITQRKQAEEALRRFELLSDHGRDIILFIRRDDGRILEANAAAINAYGYNRDELLALSIQDLRPPHTQALTSDQMVEADVRGILFETVHRRKNGSTFPVEVSSRGATTGATRTLISVIRDITARRQAEDKLRQKTHELGERVKELNCLYALSKLIEKSDISLPEICQGLVDMIPSGWQYPEITCARLVLENQSFTTANFMETAWKQSSPILVEGRHIGDLEVYSLDGKPELEEGPFLKDERNLIDDLASRLGKNIKRIRAEETLQEAHGELEQRVKGRTADLQNALSEIKALKDRLEAENVYLRREIGMKHRFGPIIGQSDALRYILHRVEQVASTDATVLVLGETGTGKELIVAAIHQMSPRKDRPLITVNCAALPANLIESELFGREKGAFTGADMRQIGRFEVANGSTLCLDEIGELPLELQAKLLRVIEHNEFQRLGSAQTIKVDARIIATTNRNLEEEVRKGRFRKDLYYRLNGFPLTVPPLRQRKEDIPLLVQAFIGRYARKSGKQFTSIQKDTMEALMDYPWPGNIRELENVIERAVILCSGPALQLAEKLENPFSLSSSTMVRTLQETERDQILKALSETRWRINGKKGAALILGIHPSTLRARIHKLGILRPGTKASD
jgi:PAS domain S-box-containing protein